MRVALTWLFTIFMASVFRGKLTLRCPLQWWAWGYGGAESGVAARPVSDPSEGVYGGRFPAWVSGVAARVFAFIFVSNKASPARG